MDSEKSGYEGLPEGPVLARTEVAKAMDAATSAPSGEGDSSGLAVLAQPLVTGSEGKGSTFIPAGKGTLTVAGETFSDTQDMIRAKCRVVSESTDDFVHDSPWKAIAMAALGGIIVGMLAAR